MEKLKIDNNPPGYPGVNPSWSISSKDGVGTANSIGNRLWFTISKGIINEIYYPRIDQANIKDMQFLISSEPDIFEDEKKLCTHQILPIKQGVPAFNITNKSINGICEINKIVLTDPRREVLIQKVQFKPLKGVLSDYHLYVILTPHIKNCGFGNNGWMGDYKGIPMLFAQRDDVSLALACSIPFINMSCGYVGFSDGWQDISKNKRLTKCYSKAIDGNIALTGEIDLSISKGEFIIVLAFGNNAAEAGQLARTTLIKNFDQMLSEFKKSWEKFQKKCLNLRNLGEKEIDIYRISTSVLKTHMDKRFSDGIIASLSIPWGFSKGDNDLGGYHLIWPRDLVEIAGGLLAAGDTSSARQILLYLMSTQEADGHWPQNMWLDGTSYWQGIQMDETAFPILLANALKQNNELYDLDIWPMVKQAASFLVCNGPVSQEDRWEEDAGYSPFTLAVEISALLAAAEFAEEAGEHQIAKFLTETADMWNSKIEQWTYIKNTKISKKLNIEGYYVRIGPKNTADAASPLNGYVPIKNKPPNQSKALFEYIVSPDALALVRFGLRSANDPRIINTVKVIDSLLKTETKTGPVWYRYNQDGYGEHENGDPFDGTGIGRGWPLLVGERAHYELARGNISEAKFLCKVIERQTGPGGLIPEQIWDSEDIPEKDLFNGHPTGSAMPLVWAHAEYIKLLHSIHKGSVFDMPKQTFKRYITGDISSNLSKWSFNHKSRQIAFGKQLRIELLSPAIIHWTIDDWASSQELKTIDSELGIHYGDLPISNLAEGIKIIFTFYWINSENWENKNFEVVIKKSKQKELIMETL
ncbi:MAG: glucan 1,4-alpha-glucosidase [Promethearchaeota archaeon]